MYICRKNIYIKLYIYISIHTYADTHRNISCRHLLIPHDVPVEQQPLKLWLQRKGHRSRLPEFFLGRPVAMEGLVGDAVLQMGLQYS